MSFVLSPNSVSLQYLMKTIRSSMSLVNLYRSDLEAVHETQLIQFSSMTSRLRYRRVDSGIYYSVLFDQCLQEPEKLDLWISVLKTSFLTLSSFTKQKMRKSSPPMIPTEANNFCWKCWRLFGYYVDGLFKIFGIFYFFGAVSYFSGIYQVLSSFSSYYVRTINMEKNNCIIY